MLTKDKILNYMFEGPIAKPVLFYLDFMDEVLRSLAELLGAYHAVMILDGERIIKHYHCENITEKAIQRDLEKAWKEYKKFTSKDLEKDSFSRTRIVCEGKSGRSSSKGGYVIPVLLKNSYAGVVFLGFSRAISTVQKNAADAVIARMLEKVNNFILKNQITNANETLRRRFNTINTLQSIITAVSSTEDATSLMQKVLDFSIKEVEGNGGSIQLVNNTEGVLYVRVASGLSEEVIKTFKKPLGDGIVGKVAVTGKPVILTTNPEVIRSSRNPDYYRLVSMNEVYSEGQRMNVKSAISVPMKVKNSIIGVLNITSTIKDFTETECEILESYASLASQIFENKRLYLEEEKRNSELEKINAMGKSLTAMRDRKEILRFIFASLEELIPFKVGLCVFETQKSINIKISSKEKISEQCIQMVKNFSLFSYGEMLGDSHFTKKINCFQIQDFPNHQSEVCYENRSYLIVPIFIKSKVRGLIAILDDKENAFVSDNLRTLSTIASYVSIAMENSEILGNMEEKVRELSILFEVSKTISSTLDLDQVLQLIIKITSRLLNADICILRLYDNSRNELTLRAFHGVQETKLQQSMLCSDETVMSEVIKSGTTVTIYDLKTDFRTRTIFNKYKLGSMISVPLVIRGETIGVINCYTKECHVFTDGEKNLLFTLASHATVAIENAKLYGTMEKNYFSTIAALAAAIDTKDHYTHGHSKMVMEYAASIAEELKLTKREIDNIKFAGLLHDIGKIGISESILLKNSALTDDEFAIIQQHPKMGAFIMEQVDFLKDIAPITFHHHEKFDGTGYPDGLRGSEIPIGSRILAVADSFDAMTSTRSYRQAMGFEDAIEEIRKNSGRQFDPDVVNAFMNVIRHKMKLRKMNLLKSDMMNDRRKRRA